MKANLYDFDKTVFPTDSETIFWLFCLKKQPSLLRYLPKQLFALIKFIFKIGDMDRNKSKLFSFLKSVDHKKMVEAFWEENEKHIYPFFVQRDRSLPTVVCSASPEFLLQSICDKFGVDILIGTRMNPNTGTIEGRNCKGEEKIRRIKAQIPEYEFDCVYSDSLKNDGPLFALGKRNFLVTGGKVKEINLQ